tara:strand:- start:137 stop:274 length:138 start_codon:yes stop_codon:yes gene_type:complete
VSKKKANLNKPEHETRSRFKKTSIGKSPRLSFTMMNKSKRRAHKK